jgi:hypothetical protein
VTCDGFVQPSPFLAVDAPMLAMAAALGAAAQVFRLSGAEPQRCNQRRSPGALDAVRDIGLLRRLTPTAHHATLAPSPAMALSQRDNTDDNENTQSTE